MARTWRLFLAVALLCAQQSALAHQIWHFASKAGVPQAAAPAQSDRQGTDPLCNQHAALGDVVGALSGKVPLVRASEALRGRLIPSQAQTASIAGLAPSSRGPPAS